MALLCDLAMKIIAIMIEGTRFVFLINLQMMIMTHHRGVEGMYQSKQDDPTMHRRHWPMSKRIISISPKND